MVWIYLVLAGINITEEHRFSLDTLDLYSIPPMIVTPAGDLIFLDTSEKQLVFVNPQGVLIKRVAGKGQGPGELEGPGYLQWLPAKKRIAVADRMTQRTSYWDEEGRFIRSDSNLGSVAFDLFYLSDTQIVHDADPSGVFESHPQLILSTAGQEDRLLFSYQLKKKKPLPMVTLSEDDLYSKRLPWDTELVFGVGPGFVVVSFSESNLIHIKDYKGKDLVDPFPSRLPARRLTEARIREFLSIAPVRFRKPMAKIIHKPPYWPLLNAIRVDHRANIWLMGPMSGSEFPVPFRIITRKGDLLGEGTLPGTPAVITGDKLYLFEESAETETIHLIRMRVTQQN